MIVTCKLLFFCSRRWFVYGGEKRLPSAAVWCSFVYECQRGGCYMLSFILCVPLMHKIFRMMLVWSDNWNVIFFSFFTPAMVVVRSLSISRFWFRCLSNCWRVVRAVGVEEQVEWCLAGAATQQGKVKLLKLSVGCQIWHQLWRFTILETRKNNL